MRIDINKKLQDQANEITRKAVEQSGFVIDEKLEEILNGIVVMSLRQGFIWGINSIKQTTELLLNDVKKGE
jgi:hypothetical protein